ncbi:zinc ribbon domain-containing protein [Streptomyces sp. NPDC058066]|uniref:zinc ribbon domain-containing protein n=1 Tax=Streptomyces sp. NPDC058066 TaxID=3346323 RepID=UPI0036E0224D
MAFGQQPGQLLARQRPSREQAESLGHQGRRVQAGALPGEVGRAGRAVEHGLQQWPQPADTGIRARVRLRKPQRATHSSWAFAQLGAFIAYKARRAGVPVVFVDPAYTSQQCCECGHIDKVNRASQALFTCRNCGVVAHADRNASHNVARKGEAVWTAGRESRVPATP